MDHPTEPASGRGLRSRTPLDTGWRLRLVTPHPDAVVDEMLVTLLAGETATFHVSTAPLPDPAMLTTSPVLCSVNATLHG